MIDGFLGRKMIKLSNATELPQIDNNNCSLGVTTEEMDPIEAEIMRETMKRMEELEKEEELKKQGKKKKRVKDHL
jgi:hypothetical protein